jgi:Ca2+-binding EF-hand superfamily protein
MKRLITFALFAIATLSVAAVQPSAAQPPHADMNRDHKVSLYEFQSFCRSLFMKADTKGDGRITREEWDKAIVQIRAGLEAKGYVLPGKRGTGASFDVLDANHNGVITVRELDAASRAWFQRLDTNHDGYIERSEIMERLHAAHTTHP